MQRPDHAGHDHAPQGEDEKVRREGENAAGLADASQVAVGHQDHHGNADPHADGDRL